MIEKDFVKGVGIKTEYGNTSNTTMTNEEILRKALIEIAEWNNERDWEDEDSTPLALIGVARKALAGTEATGRLENLNKFDVIYGGNNMCDLTKGSVVMEEFLVDCKEAFEKAMKPRETLPSEGHSPSCSWSEKPGAKDEWNISQYFALDHKIYMKANIRQFPYCPICGKSIVVIEASDD